VKRIQIIPPMLVIPILLLFMTMCTTISVNIVETAGTASDVIDETQSPSNTVDVKGDIPLSIIPK